jgi:Zn-dependent protease
MHPDSLLDGVRNVIPLVLSLSVHEWAHAYSAYRLGDDTAARQGRLTLNPLAHIDWVGSVLLPLMGVPFGWAKPVPVNPTRFTRKVHMRTGMMITASAGPLANVALALLCIVSLGMMWRLSIENQAAEELLKLGFGMNCGLAIFNMLPIPPLDGGNVLSGLLPKRFATMLDQVRPYGFLLLYALLFTDGFYYLVVRPSNFLRSWLP